MSTTRGNGNEPPHLNKRHSDGPFVVFSNGQMHWLTPWERVLLLFGKYDAIALQRKYQGGERETG